MNHEEEYDSQTIRISESSPNKSNTGKNNPHNIYIKVGDNEPMLYVDVNLGNNLT